MYPLLINFYIALGAKSSIWPCWHNVWTIWDSILEVFSCNTDWKGNYKNSHTGLCSSHYHILWYFGHSIAILLVVFFCTTSLFYPTPVMLFLVTCSANYLDICCFALLLYCYTLYVLQSIARKIKRRSSKEKEKEMNCVNFEIFVGEEIFLKASLYIWICNQVSLDSSLQTVFIISVCNNQLLDWIENELIWVLSLIPGFATVLPKVTFKLHAMRDKYMAASPPAPSNIKVSGALLSIFIIFLYS